MLLSSRRRGLSQTPRDTVSRAPQRTVAAVITAASATLALAFAPLAAAAAQQPARAHSAASEASLTTSAADGTATVSVYAGNSGTVQPGQPVTITIDMANTTANVIPAATATIQLTQSPLPTRRSLDDWLASSGDAPATRVIGSATTSLITVGTKTRAATVTIPAAALQLTGGALAVYGLQATVSDASGTVGSGRSSLVSAGSGTSHPVGLSMAMPITVPPTASGIISSASLATYTASDGLLTRQLQLAQEHPSIAIAIDPMIIASIRVLGTSAPPSAHTWLVELAALSNDSFPLQYGDADVAGEVQAGFSSLLAPTSFGYLLETKNFPTPLDVGETPTPTPTSNAFVTPTPTSQPSTVPTLQQLMSWPYTFSGIAWPADDSLRSADVDALTSDGYPSTIVSGSNTDASELASTPNAPMSVKGGTALVTDQGVSSALRAVVSATTTDEANSALASASGQLAEISAQSAGGTVILAGLDRGWPANESETSKALDAVFALPWVQPSSLRDALNSPLTSGLKLVDATPDAGRIAAIHAIAADAGGMDQFATVLTDPTVLTGNTRNQVLSLLGVGWTEPDNTWGQAVGGFHQQAVSTIDSVQIVPTGKITVASTQSLIPVTVNNKFGLPINVVLRATPSNVRLEVDSDTPKDVPAQASVKVLVPVKAKLGNGTVKLALQLYSVSNVPIGSGQTAAIDVHADWEGLGALILGIVVVLFFGFGLVRSILRRRSAQRERTSSPDDADSAASAASSGGEAMDARATPEHPDAPEDSPRG
jgi:hypothetical protein